jgi:thiamine-monophosphate kinase
VNIKELGEQGLLQRLQAFCPPGMIGDDAAMLAFPQGLELPESSLIVTTDLLVDQVHFSDRTTPAHAVGWRAVAANLSDLAAMGATPIALTVGLGLPGDTPVAWVEQVYQGMVDCLAKFGGQIVGGDLVRSPVRTLAITAFGQVDPAAVIRRSQAQVGDAILVTGYHGNSRAGLELLLHPEVGQHLLPVDRDRWIQSHQYPIPRFDVIHSLGQLLAIGASACQGWQTIAGMDSSDGLADAVLQLCRASRVGAELSYRHLPIDPALQHTFANRALEWCLYGGEDFELVLCLPPRVAHDLLARLIEVGSTGATIVGKVIPDPQVLLIDTQQQWPTQILRLEQGFQHFAT